MSHKLIINLLSSFSSIQLFDETQQFFENVRLVPPLILQGIKMLILKTHRKYSVKIFILIELVKYRIGEYQNECVKI